MHHVRIVLDRHVVGDAHRADLRHAPDVVAAEIHQHHVLGALFRVRQQLLGERRVFVGRLAARARAGDRPQCDVAVLKPHQDFGRCADDVKIVEVEEKHVGRGIERAQRAIQREWARAERLAHALRQHHLHDVAVEDVALGAFDHLKIGRFAELRARLLRRGGRRVRDRHRTAQHLQQLFQALAAALIGAGCTWIDVHDEIDFARQVVDHRELLRQQEQDVRHAERIGLGVAGELFLDIADGVVAEIADQAAAETRQAGLRGRLEARLILPDVLQRVVGSRAALELGVFELAAFVAAHLEPRFSGQPDERIAAEALAADHRFEQVGVRLIGELEVDRQRSIEVGEGFQHQRDAVIALGRKLVEL